MRGQLVWFNSSCVATACYPEIEGPTEIVLGSGSEVALRAPAAFDGMIDSLEGLVVVTTVGDNRPVLQLDVSTALTRVRICKATRVGPKL